MAKKSIIGIFAGASFLVVLVLVLVFLYAQSFTSSGIFPENTDFWNKILTGYLVIFALVLGVIAVVQRDVIISLAKAKYWKAFFTRFIPSAVITSIILIILKVAFKGSDSVPIFQIISYMPFGVVMVHLFVVAQIEEILFGGLIYKTVEKRSSHNSANIITMILFALWHFAKTGGNWIVMITYAPLRFWWNYLNQKGTPVLNKIAPRYFGATPNTQQAGAGGHFAWNMFVIGLIEPFR